MCDMEYYNFGKICQSEPVHGARCNDCFPSRNCRLTLKNSALWRKFHELETEMIITKTGRRMFPSLVIEASGLDPHTYYSVALELATVSNSRFKYSNSGGWAPTSPEETQSPQRVYMHPDSPATGEYWMSQPISFGRLKLTNTPAPPEGQVVLSSMHKYQPVVVISSASHPRSLAFAPRIRVSFPETMFIAVTAYQNERITKLKIDNNPFAKGFRESGQSKCKRKKISEREEEEPPRKELKLQLPSSPELRDGSISDSCGSPPSRVEICRQPAAAQKKEISPYHQIPPISPPPVLYSCIYPFYAIYPQAVYGTYPYMCFPAAYQPPMPPTKTPTRRYTDFSIRAITEC